MTPTTTPDRQNAAMLLQEKSALISQTNQGPGLEDVGAKLLREALGQQYPELNIDPDHTLLVTPQWRSEGDSLISLAPHAQTLTTTLLRQSQSSHVANYIEGEHFLTPAPLSASPVQLAVSIEDIANLLNDLAPLLLIEFQQQQLAYWNETVNAKPRWQELSDTLKKALNLQQVKGWTADQCEVARAVSAHPDKAERAIANAAIPGIQACLIDIDYNEPDNTRHLLLGGAIILKATHNQRDMLLLYTIEGGYERFDSMDALGASLPGRIDMETAGLSLQWRLFEPDGNIFDYMAWALIAGQMEMIAALKSAIDPPLPLFTPAAGGTRGFSDEEKKYLDQLEASIPDWLARASASELQAYGHYLSSQGRLRNASGLNDIPLIAPYAQEHMRNAIVADRRAHHGNDAATLPLDQLQIIITHSFTAGAFTLPNPHDVQVETLGEFALQNATPYKAEVKFKNNQACPAWLNVDYLVNMAQQVDIGKHYPALLKAKLIDNAAQAKLQQHRYVSLLPDLMRLKALECKLQNEGGVDAIGYRYVCQLMDIARGHPRKHPLDITIRPLSFIPRHRTLSVADIVANMFIIGPRHPHNGPCLLYRPALEQPLLQFASLQNLIYAIHQPGELRDSVLAWLPTPALSFEYSQYVFPVGLPSPWLATETGVELLLNLDLSGPISLGNEAITDNLLPALFASNAHTLIEQADRQSQSNGERRWTLLRDSGWAIFNVASTFLTGPVGTAAWVWQSIGQLQQGLEAHERGNSLVEWTSLSDVLMALGMLLIHHASQRRTTVESEHFSRNKRKKSQPPAPVPHPAPTPAATLMTLDPTVLSGELPTAHATALEAGESVPRRTASALGAYLDSVKVNAPDLTDTTLATLNETPPHLYQLNDKQYARVGNRWFQVRVDDDEQVLIFNPDTPSRSGPLLTHDLQGNWYVDTRLRLRGGGLKSRLKAIKLEKSLRKDALHEKIQAFKNRESILEAEINVLHEALTRASGNRFDAQATQLTDRLEVLIEEHRQAIEHLNEWRELGGTVGYTYDLLRMTTLLEKHLSMWFSIKSNQYSITIAPMTGEGTLNAEMAVGDNLPAVEKAIALSQAIIERTELAYKAVEGLKVLGRVARETSVALRNLLPRHSPLEYKANEIGMAYELCVQEQASAKMPQARAAVANIVVEASEASQTLTDIVGTSQAGNSTEHRIAALTPLLDIFADTLQRIEDLPGQYPGMTHPQALNRLQALIKEFQALAQTQLYDLLPEIEPPLASTVAIAGPSRAQGKVTKTRPRDSIPATEQKTEAATFKKLLRKSEQRNKPVRDDIDVIDDGMKLNLELHSFITRTREDAQRANRIPADMQHLFDSQALKYEEEATAVETAQANIRAAIGTPPPVSTLPRELRDAATRLRSTGISVRASMLKKRKPRLEYFQWLHENGQVKVVRNEQGRIKTRQQGDYFQEYRILDTTRNDQPLWVAHFHYAGAHSPASQPTTAHLKVADSYLQTLEPALRQQLSEIEPADYVFRLISDPSARALFIALEPQAPAPLAA